MEFRAYYDLEFDSGFRHTARNLGRWYFTMIKQFHIVQNFSFNWKLP